MKKIAFLICLVVLIILVCFLIFLKFNSTPSISTPDNWKEYVNHRAGFSIKYDPTLILQESSQTDVRFYKLGPTQRGQTEMYDGIIFSIQKVNTENGVNEYINSRVEEFKNVGTITEPLHNDKLGTIPIKKFSASSLGDFDLIFISLDDKTLLEISYMAPDPTNAGFKKVAELMLLSLRIIR